MALLRWIHLRKLVPIEELIQSAGKGLPAPRTAPVVPQRPAVSASPAPAARVLATVPVQKAQAAPAVAAVPSPKESTPNPGARSPEPPVMPGAPRAENADNSTLKDAFLSEIRKSNAVLYNSVIVQAQRMEVRPDRVVLTFTAVQKMGPAFDKYRPVLEALATKLAGRKMSVVSEISSNESGPENAPGRPTEAERKSALKEEAMADAGVQALLEVFPAEIRDVEEM
jgi:hypothetical protein